MTPIEKAPIGSGRLSADGRFLAVDEAWCRILGYGQAQLCGLGLAQLVAPEDRNGLLPLGSADGSAYALELRCRSAGGDIRWTRLTVAGQRHGPDNPLTFLCTLEDVSAQREARHLQQLMEQAIVRAPEGVFWLNPQGRFIDVNEQACRSLQYTRDELIGMAVWDIDPDFSEARWQASWSGTRARGQRRFETRHRRKDGVIFPVEIQTNYFQFGGTEYDCAFARDITDRKRAEEALEQRVNERTSELAASNRHLQETLDTLERAKDELVRHGRLASLGALVAGVAHELNTPIGNSLTVATTLADKAASFAAAIQGGELRRSVLNEFVDQSAQAAALLTRCLAQAADLITHFKHVAVDQASAQRRQFDLAETVSEVVSTLRPQLKATRHRIVLDIPGQLLMDSFPGPLGQIIVNLVGNALLHGFADDMAGEIHIAAAALDETSIQLMVKDNGKGVAPELLPRIFDPFFTTRLGQGGSGLGLHIVYSITTRVLGGRIAVSSEPGAGTGFLFELPRSAPALSAEGQEG